eukprot:15735274-Heterocapsa_arctica.AAC.1
MIKGKTGKELERIKQNRAQTNPSQLKKMLAKKRNHTVFAGFPVNAGRAGVRRVPMTGIPISRELEDPVHYDSP